MNSAYQILGVPPDANRQDIASAYTAAQRLFAPERLVADPSLHARWLQVQEAYRILATPELREAHDRTLAQSTTLLAPRGVLAAPCEVKSAQSPALLARVLPVVLLLVAGWAGVQWWVGKRQADQLQALESRHEARQEQLNHTMAEGARQQLDFIEREIRTQELANRERTLAQEALMAAEQAQRAAAAHLQESQRVVREEQVRRAQAGEEEQPAAPVPTAAQRELAKDRERLRNLCMMNHGVPDC